MAWWTLALIGLVGAVAYLWERALRADTEKERDVLLMERDLARKQLADAADEAKRFKDVIAYLRAETERLNNEVASCTLPGAARERLQRLLSQLANPEP